MELKNKQLLEASIKSILEGSQQQKSGGRDDDDGKPNYIKDFLERLQEYDKDTFDLFLEEAREKGLYSEKKVRNQTLSYARSGYYRNYIKRDNERYEKKQTEEFKHYVLYEDKKLTKADRIHRHLNELLTPEEKQRIQL